LTNENEKRIEELEDQLKVVLDRESATHLRHDAKTDKLEAHIAELEAQNRELHMQVIASDSQAQMAYEEQGQLNAKLARVIEIANLIAGRMMK
jgi:outer membrane murein-binding lipoprotein Lpp